MEKLMKFYPKIYLKKTVFFFQNLSSTGKIMQNFHLHFWEKLVDSEKKVTFF